MDMIKKKIAIYVPTLRFGGGERVASNLINYLVKYDDLDVTIILYDKSQIDYEINKSINIIDINEKTDLTSFISKITSFIRKIRKIRKIIRTQKFDINLSIMPSMNLLILLANTSSSKNIVTVHNIIRNHSTLLDKLFNTISIFFYKKADRIIAVSNGVKDSLLNHNKILDIDVIYNPLDINEIKERSIDSVEFENYIVCVGRLTRQKGFDLLIEAFYKLKDKSMKLLIIGEGEEEKNLKEIALRLHLLDRIIFLGFQDNPYKYMKHSNCFVLSSRWEGFGLVLAEALVTGTQVVSFNCPSGPSEILINGEIGYLAEANNVQELVYKIELALVSDINNELINSRIKDFDIEYISKQYYKIIKEL